MDTSNPLYTIVARAFFNEKTCPSCDSRVWTLKCSSASTFRCNTCGMETYEATKAARNRIKGAENVHSPKTRKEKR